MWSSPFKKNNLGGQIFYKSPVGTKNGAIFRGDCRSFPFPNIYLPKKKIIFPCGSRLTQIFIDVQNFTA